MQLEGLVMDNATLTLVKQVTQLYSAKHQPGRHNQQAHDPTKGQHVQTSPGARLLELMPDVPEGATWKQKMKACEKSGLKEAYDNDPELRELVDDICGYTQGSFEQIRDAGNAIANGNPEYWAKYERARRDQGEGGKAIEEFVDRRMEEIYQETHIDWLSAVQARMEAAQGGVKFPENYDDNLDVPLKMRGGWARFLRLSGDDDTPDDIGTSRALRSAVQINSLIRSAGDSDVTLYRGMKVSATDAALMERDYPVGSEMELGGATSFTADRDIALKFIRGGSAGGAKINRDKAGKPYIIEIQPGAKSVDVNALSPYKQHEHLTQGKFEVVDVIPGGEFAQEGEYYLEQPGRIVLRQKEVPVQTLPAWAKRKE